MPYLRLLLAWAIMFAIPVQGLAAATMLFCGQGTAHHAQAAAVPHEHAPGAAAHDHAAHAAQAEAAQQGGHVKPGGETAPDLMHKCSVCASCCHAIGMAPGPLVVLADGPGRAAPAEPVMAAYSRPSLVPDKPPRA
jgi:hypothetical protein